ncbi:MAG: DnaD domain protein [Chloroflexi bacterium]|nr:DnaD domain protein [Chloroflexota bacterium]
MASFTGFPSGKVRFTSIPAPFFTELLPNIDHLGELKVTLYTFWRLDRMEGSFRYLQESDFSDDKTFMDGLGKDSQKALGDALKRCVARGTLLALEVELDDDLREFYFLNTPRGQAAVKAIEAGEWKPSGDPQLPLQLSEERPNIFRLYEENIGALTPIIADRLREAEENYPAQWLDDAVSIAVENNVRRWRYIEAILHSWQEEGRNERTHQGDSEKDRRKYIEGEFAEFIEH